MKPEIKVENFSVFSFYSDYWLTGPGTPVGMEAILTPCDNLSACTPLSPHDIAAHVW